MRVLAAIKLFYLYLIYWFVGLDEEGFQIGKGAYLIEMKMYPAAAKAYQRALKETDSVYVHSALGYCYLCMDIYDKAINTLNLVYKRKPTLDVAIWLAYAHHHSGNTEECAKFYRVLKESNAPKSQEVLEEIHTIEAMLQEAASIKNDGVVEVKNA
ncbi:MAG: tetratricopeptide repeat protein [Smithellaceae bacterium]